MRSTLRTCPVCKQLVEPTRGGRDGSNVLKHRDRTNVSVCPMSGKSYELTYPVQSAVPWAETA